MNRPPYRRVDQVAAYLYRADLHCPTCIIETMIATGLASPAARDMPVEEVLDQCADANAIDRDDETTFDSHEYPKVVVLGDLNNDDVCGSCQQPF